MEKLNEMEQTRGCQRTTSSSICLLASGRAVQFFFFLAVAFLFSAALLCGALSSGTTYSLSFVDINGNMGERVPDYCLGNPNYRMITIIRFVRKRGPIMRKIAMGVVRHRVTEEAKRLQSRYDTNKIMRDARQDIFTVTDFDGSASSQLGDSAESGGFRVLVFARDGKLLEQWMDVPSAKQLADVLK
jgi:hypothetical protein